MTCGVQNTLDEHVSSLECDTNDVRCSGHTETSSSRGHPAEIHHTIIGNLSATESADNIHGTRPRSSIEVYMTFNTCISSDLLSQNQLQPHDLQYLYFFRIQIFFHKINYSPMTFNTCISSDLLSQNQLQPHDLQYLYFFRVQIFFRKINYSSTSSQQSPQYRPITLPSYSASPYNK